MAKFCSNCGKEVADGMTFCQECGAKIDNDAEVSAQVNEQPAVNPVSDVQPVSQPDSVSNPAEEEKFKTVKTSTYFWLEFLFAIPVIGLIVCLIIAFAPKNKNLRNFAKSKLIWLLVLIIISALLTVIGLIIGSSILKQFGVSSFAELIKSLIGG